MPVINHNTKPLDVAGINHHTTNVQFTTTVAGAVGAFAGASVRSIARTGVGTYLVTLSPFAPCDFVSGSAREVGGTVRQARLGQVVLDAPSKTTTIVVYAHAFGGALVDASGLDIRLILHWKMFSGKDWSGL